MNLGLIEQIGTPVEMYRFPNNRFVANFIGRANFVSGIVQEQHDGSLTVKALGEVITLKNIKRQFKKQEEATLVVRPEMVRIKRTGELYKGIIRRAVFLGDVIEYDIEVNGQLLPGLETDPYITELFPEGEEVTVGFAEGCIQALPVEKTHD